MGVSTLPKGDNNLLDAVFGSDVDPKTGTQGQGGKTSWAVIMRKIKDKWFGNGVPGIWNTALQKLNSIETEAL